MAARYDVGVLGLGYIGIPLAVLLAERGLSVLGFDIDVGRVARLAAGELPIVEDGLAEAFAAGRERLHFSAHADDLALVQDLYCICVGTPLGEAGSAHLGQLHGALDTLAPRLAPGRTVVLRSTVPLGTSRRLAQETAKQTGLALGADLFWGYWPERTTEGVALHELRTLPQIVAGLDRESADRAGRIVSRVGSGTLYAESLEAAELVKLMDNAYRATAIAFANEMGDICRLAGLDAAEVFTLANTGYARTDLFLPGLGAGGPCLSKDPAMLMDTAYALGANPRLLAASVASNREATDEVIAAARRVIDGRAGEPTAVAVLGLAFKGRPATDDTRAGPAEAFCEAVRNVPGLDLRFCDPVVREFQGHPVEQDWRRAVVGAHLVLCLTNAPAFSAIDADELARLAGRPLFVADCWHGVQDVAQLRAHAGVDVLRIGDGSR